MFGAAKKSEETLDIKKIEKSLKPISNDLYAYQTEVTNLDYRIFLKDLKIKGLTDKYNLCMVDSLGWNKGLMYIEPYVQYYFRHPAYNCYPLVNISYEAANIYCEWLTEKYHSFEKRKFKKVKFKLPTEEEWLKAARGGLDESAIFPWKGISLRNKYQKGTTWKGEYLCNFKDINQACIRKESASNKLIVDCKKEGIGKFISPLNYHWEITASVYSFMPNGYGLYNVCGNVAEMLSEKGRTKGGSWASYGYYVRLDTEDEYAGFTKPSPMIGFRYFMVVIEE